MTLLKSLLLIILTLLLANCATPPPVVQPEPIDRTPLVIPEIKLDETNQDLQNQRLNAENRQDWPNYLITSHQLWLQNPEQQRAIELDTWQALQALDQTTQLTLSQHSDERVFAWGWLLETRQIKGFAFKRALEDIQHLLPEAMFNRHLIGELQAQQTDVLENRTIAILLPFSDRYRAISEQIRSGLLKAYWQSNQTHTLLFFDTQEDSQDIYATYLQAKQAGADLVIGPLTRPAIQLLAQHKLNDVISLNEIEQATDFWQFNFKNQSEARQLIRQLETQHYRHIAVITNDSPVDTRFTQELQAHWVEQHAFPLTIHSYPLRNPNLRAEMNKALNADQSQSRAAFLSRSLAQPIEFFPRIRKDLEAMILVGDDKQVSVLRPQLDFYDLQIPLYGTSGLTPESLNQDPVNRDLKSLILPTIPAALTPSPLNNRLEAFGWDSFMLAHYHPLMTPDLFINGATGRLSIRTDKRIQATLNWARYRSNGKLTPLEPEKFSPPYFVAKNPHTSQQLTPEQIESIRQDLLQDIIQPRLELNPTEPTP